MMPLEKPSPAFHAVCAYWLMSRDGSKAKAQPQHASRMPSAIQARACLRDLAHAAMHIIIILRGRDPETRRNFSRRELCANCRPFAGGRASSKSAIEQPDQGQSAVCNRRHPSAAKAEF